MERPIVINDFRRLSELGEDFDLAAATLEMGRIEARVDVQHYIKILDSMGRELRKRVGGRRESNESDRDD